MIHRRAGGAEVGMAVDDGTTSAFGKSKEKKRCFFQSSLDMKRHTSNISGGSNTF